MIRTVHLTKKYDDLVAVDSLDLTIGEGEFFSLLGINGAGKTTTIQMLTGVASPSGGQAYVNGFDIIKQVNDVKRCIGVSAQETAIAPNLTVKENLVFIGRIYGFSRQETEQKVNDVSSLLDLQSVLHRKAGLLSGGWKRRVSIAMALLCEPKVLFLDEPTLGLDVLARRALWDFLASLRGRITVFMTTHYLEEAERLSDRVGIMRDGKLLAVGALDELKKSVGAADFESAFVTIVKGEDA